MLVGTWEWMGKMRLKIKTWVLKLILMGNPNVKTLAVYLK